MKIWDYEEDGLNVLDSVHGVVTGENHIGLFLTLEDGQQAFARFGGIKVGTVVPCTVLKKASERWKRVLVSIDSSRDAVCV